MIYYKNGSYIGRLSGTRNYESLLTEFRANVWVLKENLLKCRALCQDSYLVLNRNGSGEYKASRCSDVRFLYAQSSHSS